MIEGRWVRISTLHRSTLGDNLTFYLPELLCRICHWMYSTASHWALNVCFFSAEGCGCMCGPSAPSSEMHWGVLVFQRPLSLPRVLAAAPLTPAHRRGPSRPCRSGPIARTAWPCEAATLSSRARFRCHSCLSSRPPPLTWTRRRTLTEVGPPSGAGSSPWNGRPRVPALPPRHSSLGKRWPITTKPFWYQVGKEMGKAFERRRLIVILR